MRKEGDQNMSAGESVHINYNEVSVATKQDLPELTRFLADPAIDNLFTPPLSHPDRGMTIENRVRKKHEGNNGSLGWIIVKHEGKIVGCMAVVPADMDPTFVKDESKKVDEGISVPGWEGKKIYEISTVASASRTEEGQNIKGIGAAMLTKAAELVSRNPNAALLTDSWVGGEMGDFTRYVVNKYPGFAKPEGLKDANFDVLIRMFSDPGKRGVNGPPTVIYLVPTNEADWQMLVNIKGDIAALREKYNQIAQSFH